MEQSFGKKANVWGSRDASRDVMTSAQLQFIHFCKLLLMFVSRYSVHDSS